MSDHTNPTLTAREMVRSHAYPALAALGCLSLMGISVLLIPQAVRHHRYNSCIDRQVQMRVEIYPKGRTEPGLFNYLKAVEHCQGYPVEASSGGS